MSPFLRLCRDGSIPWRALDQAVDEAVRRDLPLLILAGRALDHWSARWVAELGAQGALGELVATAFVPAAVDVDRDPPTARAIQRALAATADASGWPALALALPDGRLVGAGAYAPPAAPGAQPPAAAMLVAMADAWRERRDDLEDDALRLGLLPDDPGPGELPGELHAGAAEAHAMGAADTLAGGFGPGARHPLPALLGFLLARAARPEAPLPLAQQLERTCAALTAGALHDHLGGGFFRTCRDPGWREPAGEKRARDAFLLALVLWRAERVLPAAGAWSEPALRACGWALGDCARADGLVAHGLCAYGPDGAGGWAEGAAWRWTRAQAAAVLGEDGARICARRFGLDDTARVPAVQATLVEADAARLPELVARLQAARAERPPHPRDGTAFTADQGLALCALAEAHLRDPAGPWRTRVLALWSTLASDHPPAWWEDDGTAAAVPAGQRALAWLARGAWAARICGCLGAAERAHAWAEAALACGPADPADDEDGPSTAAVLAEACCDLTEEYPGWRRAAEAVVAGCAGAMRQAPLTCAGLWAARERLHR
ncbi:MAG: DUF255 domain-containing protein [Planctomycetes bacterium]|nr:DUF255 domain-containing protein [Planctomycetota bacterium]